jgi:hypothetical protein
MSKHAQQPSPEDPSAEGGDRSKGARPAGADQKAAHRNDGSVGQGDAQMQEAIDRATAAVGQDDGKR